MIGLWLIVLASLLGLAVAGYDYVTPMTGINGSAGVVVVLIALGLMLVSALVLALFLRRGWLHRVLSFLVFLDILCTGAAAWFLESNVLLALMVLALVGFVIRLARGSSARARSIQGAV